MQKFCIKIFPVTVKKTFLQRKSKENWNSDSPPTGGHREEKVAKLTVGKTQHNDAKIFGAAI